MNMNVCMCGRACPLMVAVWSGSGGRVLALRRQGVEVDDERSHVWFERAEKAGEERAALSHMYSHTHARTHPHIHTYHIHTRPSARGG